jgi:nucleoside-diphosphate-sugar epimerase
MLLRKCPLRILVTGAFGQIGSELVPALRNRYGNDNVIAAGHKTKPSPKLAAGPYTFIDTTKRETIEKAVEEYDVGIIYHLPPFSQLLESRTHNLHGMLTSTACTTSLKPPENMRWNASSIQVQ